jgi:hypothetical protein
MAGAGVYLKLCASLEAGDLCLNTLDNMEPEREQGFGNAPM